MQQIEQDWYDFPLLYDVAFSWAPDVEVDFLEAAFAEFAQRDVRAVYEPFVGPGRIALELVRRDYSVIGTDNNAAMIEYARRKAEREPAPPAPAPNCEQTRAGCLSLTVADAADFVTPTHVDAVVTLIDSFRHLAAPGEAERALSAFRRSLAPGGLLILGIDVGEKPIEITAEEQWSMQRDGRTVGCSVFSLRRPGPFPGSEMMRAILTVTEPDGRQYQVRCDSPMRKLTQRGLRDMLHAAGFEPLRWCDRRYDLNRPIPESGYTGDVVVIARAV